jgi:hypothetical protein
LRRNVHAGTKLHDMYRSASLQGTGVPGLGMVGRLRPGYPAELLLDLFVQPEGIKLGVAQQHAGDRDAERCRHAVGELRGRLAAVELCLGQADLQPQLQVPAQRLPLGTQSSELGPDLAV